MATALIATVIVFALLSIAGFLASRRLQGSAIRRITLVSGLLLTLPCVAFATYYLHWWDEPVLLYRFRALPGSELAAGLSGWLAGWCAHLLISHQRQMVRLTSGALAVLPLLIVVPYLKPLLSPLDLDRLSDRWRDDVCLQSSGSTCGPSCAATLLKASGHALSERSLAEAAHTTVGGTECWYLVRAMRAGGLAISMSKTGPNPQHMPWPAIAGTRLGRDGAGHYVTVLGESPEGYVIGDPLEGRLTLSREQLRHAYWFTGFFITVDSHHR
jgi:hypothetical protein